MTGGWKEYEHHPLKHMAIMLVFLVVLGPGCGAIVGSLYGDVYSGLMGGALLIGIVCVMVLPTLIKRSRDR